MDMSKTYLYTADFETPMGQFMFLLIFEISVSRPYFPQIIDYSTIILSIIFIISIFQYVIATYLLLSVHVFDKDISAIHTDRFSSG